MRKIFLLLAVVVAAGNLFSQWSPQGEKLQTKWAETIDVNNVLPEYTRPIMERTEGKNLDGLWN